MEQYIPKSALVAEIERRMKLRNDSYKKYHCESDFIAFEELEYFRDEFIPTLEVNEVDLIIHTVIAECCDWLAMNTNLSHDEIEDCRNLMLTVKEEQFKALKGK